MIGYPQPTAARVPAFCLLAALLLAPASAVCGQPADAEGPVWAGSRAGVSDEVLPPWKPVEVAGGKVSVWGRTYGFGGLPLPASVKTRDTEILAAPIRLVGVAGGKELVWTEGDCRTLEARPNVVRLATQADSEALRCEGRVRVEYDGMVRCDFKLVPKGKDVRIEELALEIPLLSQYAGYLHHWPGRWGSCFNSGRLPEEGYHGMFKPFVWLGDEWRGLAWFAESDRNFFNEEGNRVIEIARRNDAVVMRINMITRAQPVDEALEYTFGFQATPVKPMKPDVWDYRICHMGAYGLEDRLHVESTSLRYPAAGQIRLDQGTFECWVRPHFDPQPDVAPDDPNRGRFNRNLLDLDLPGGPHIGFYWNIDDRGMRLYYKEGDRYPLLLGMRSPWKPGEWHHVAFTWGDATRVYVDGKKLAEQAYQGTVSGDLGGAKINLAERPCEMDIDEIRVSSVARDRFALSGPPAADAETLLLDHLDEPVSRGLRRATSPTRGSGGVVLGGRTVEGKFGRAISFQTRPEEQVTVLEHLSQAGIRTICFHEHWTDIQAYPKTAHGEELRKLVEACHQHDLQLLLYLGYQMSNIAPEWDAYHEKCLVHPRRGGYKRKYQPEPDQTAYIVCYRSIWQDFIAHHLDRLMDEYGIDGVYLDGTSEPWGCRNRQHGCGYVRSDGSIGTTYPIFDTRSMMKRIYTIVESHNPAGQVNVHQSTCMTIPTLAFATSYWDGEQLQSVARRKQVQDVLPLDAFRCEFMGHNWGVPAELLHYARGPFKRHEAVSMALLHNVLVRPGTMADVDQSAKLWEAMDKFGRKESNWLPYWENKDCVRTDPGSVKVSIYNRPDKGLIAVIANSGQEKCRAGVVFNLPALGQPANLSAWDVLSGEEIPVAAGRMQVLLESLGSVVIRLGSPSQDARE